MIVLLAWFAPVLVAVPIWLAPVPPAPPIRPVPQQPAAGGMPPQHLILKRA